jgi:hypothetical protein
MGWSNSRLSFLGQREEDVWPGVGASAFRVTDCSPGPGFRNRWAGVNRESILHAIDYYPPARQVFLQRKRDSLRRIGLMRWADTMFLVEATF